MSIADKENTPPPTHFLKRMDEEKLMRLWETGKFDGKLLHAIASLGEKTTPPNQLEALDFSNGMTLLKYYLGDNILWEKEFKTSEIQQIYSK